MPLDQAARGINHLIFAFHSRAFNVCSQNLAQQPSVNFSLGVMVAGEVWKEEVAGGISVFLGWELGNSAVVQR